MASASCLLLAASAVMLAAATRAERAALDVAALAAATSAGASGTAASSPQPNEPFISDATAYCYKTGKADINLFSDTIDKVPAKGVSNLVHLRSDAMTWCPGYMRWYPGACKVKKPAYNANASDYDDYYMRGFDLIQTPPSAHCDSPRVMYIHGGSWWMGSPFGTPTSNYYVHTSKIAHETGSVVMSIDYPLIGGWRCKEGGDKKCKTDGKYVGQFIDILDFAETAWRWLADHGPHGQKCKRPHGRAPPMFLAGDSSGGGSAFSVLLQLNKRWQDGNLEGLQRPSGAFLESPWLNLRSNTPTYYSNNFAAFPNVAVASKFPKEGALTGDLLFHTSSNPSDPFNISDSYYLNGLQYCGLRRKVVPASGSFQGSCGSNNSAEAQAHYWLASPYWAEPKHLEGLPPLYFAASATELLAGETSTVAERAASVGVHVTSELFYGMWHTFPQWSEGCQGPNPLWQGVTALSHYGDFVREVTRALKTCPQKVYGPRRAGGPTKARRVAVNSLNDLTTNPPETIPKLRMDICGNGEGAPLSFLQRRGSLRGRDALVADGGDEDSAMLQTFTMVEIDEEKIPVSIAEAAGGAAAAEL